MSALSKPLDDEWICTNCEHEVNTLFAIAWPDGSPVEGLQGQYCMPCADELKAKLPRFVQKYRSSSSGDVRFHGITASAWNNQFTQQSRK